MSIKIPEIYFWEKIANSIWLFKNNSKLQMKLQIPTLFLIGITWFAHSQNKVSGKITNSQNEPLLGVTVYVEELQKGTSTNENGEYELNIKKTGKYTLVFKILGYKTKTITLATAFLI